jgi:hypothetical protein
MQDLTPAQQEAVKQHEAMHAAHQVLNTRSINDLPTTPEEDEAMKELFEKMGQDLANHEIAHQQAQQARLDAVPPQPTTQVSAEALIEHMVAQFSTNLKLLLTTIINQPKAQPEGAQVEEKSSSNASLQETVELVLQQSDWFKSMVRETIVDEVSLEDVVKDIVKDEVESAVDTYFRNEFDPTYHFDFGDAVCSEVSDQLDDVVRDRLDEVVQEQLEEVVAEKLKSIRVVFD